MILFFVLLPHNVHHTILLLYHAIDLLHRKLASIHPGAILMLAM
jgi:hypothetical protein